MAMKMRLLLSASLVLLALSSQGAIPVEPGASRIDKLTTLSGRTYRNCRISTVHADGISFFHARGAAKVLFTDLDAATRQRWGYDEQRALQHQQQQTQLRQVALQKQQAARETLRREEQQNWELRIRLLERTALLQQQFILQSQLQLALSQGYFNGPALGGPAPAVGWPGTFTSFGIGLGLPFHGHGSWHCGIPGLWTPGIRRGSVTLASIGGGSGGYLSPGRTGLCWAGHGRVWSSPTLGLYTPGRFTPFGPAFGGVYAGGARAFGAPALGSVASGFLPTAPAAVAPAVIRSGGVGIPSP